MNDTLKTIFDRKSLRTFAEKDICKDDRELLLQAGMRAPTAGNLMSYTIIDVKDQRTKEILAETCDNQPMIAKAPMVLIFLADMQRLYDYFDYSGVPNLCKKTGISYVKPQEGDFLLAANDAIVAAENVVIAAESLGLGSCYIGDIIENFETHRDLFELPRWTFPVTMLIIGYPKQKKSNSVITRFPTEFIVHKNSYRRLSRQDFDSMFHETREHFGNAPFLKGAENLGQHIYLRKFSSDFMIEMRRSFKAGIKLWLEG